MRKLLSIALAAAAVLALTSDAQALGRRSRSSGGSCGSTVAAASCSGGQSAFASCSSGCSAPTGCQVGAYAMTPWQSQATATQNPGMAMNAMPMPNPSTATSAPMPGTTPTAYPPGTVLITDANGTPQPAPANVQQQIRNLMPSR